MIRPQNHALRSLLIVACISTAHAQYAQQGSRLTFMNGGVAASADGSTLIIGKFGDNNSVGGAVVLARVNGAWSQQGGELMGTGAVPSQGSVYQGSSVALSADGNTALVGGPFDGGDSRGAVWVFVRSRGVWSQQGSKLVGSGITTNALFGDVVALSADGNTALVGNNNTVDGAYVFTRNNGVWTQQGGKLTGNVTG
jgi:hypothetical protein